MLKQRLVSGVLLGLAAVLSATYLPSPAGWLLILALGLLAQYEFYDMTRAMGIPAFKILGMCGGALLISATFWTIGPAPEQLARGYQAEQIVLAGTLLFLLIWQAFQKTHHQPVAVVAVTMLGILYGAGLLNYLTRLAFAWHAGTRWDSVQRTGQMLIIYLIAVVKSSDIGAYFTGRLIGRHKMIPRLSPNKTWEGLGGGVVLSLGVSMLFYVLGNGQLGVLSVRWWDAVIMGLLLAASGVVGDLAESMIKRNASAKDSGRLIPGMGGVLDVLDSLLFGAPVLYAYAVLFLGM
ncbi:MAG: phosphatidate cytidylyltransferase [Kiritimatiellia bacterium]